jgi:phosphoribosylformylglycinamidine synthase II
MLYKIEVKEKPVIFDAVGAGIKKDISDLGIDTIRDVRFIQVYIIEGNISEFETKRICEELLTDKISQDYCICAQGHLPSRQAGKDTCLAGRQARTQGEFIIEVAYNPGVMDPVEESTLKGIRDLGIESVASVKTAKKYIIKGKLSESQLKTISEKLLYNKLIQHIVKSPSHPACPAGRQVTKSPSQDFGYQFNLITVDLLNATDRELQKVSSRGQLFLNLAEMKQIQKYFRKLKRNPTDCELETIAQTWSEHCCHKTFRGKIKYTEKLRATSYKLRAKTIDNLLKSTIMKVTKELNKPWCVSVFKDNSGVIRFDDKYNICFKVETHNHPSALEPFGGANTGIGGVIRDPLGTGLGAKPILNTDIFCFAPPDYPFNRLPEGSLHPKRVMKGVVSGVRDYGNKMGIPTVNGAILFHDSFVGNPLVYCGTVGILPKEKSFKQPRTGDLIVVVGGRTGRDGIHGATFSSGELTHESEKISSGAVQIGNPIQEKKMVDTILQARDLDLYSAITDCGAGGLSSAVGEMGSELGAKVFLERAPLKYSDLSYTEIWISESQERMVLSVPKENIDALMEVFENENVEATVIGEFTHTKILELYYKDNPVCILDMKFLHEGVPDLKKKAVYIQAKHKEPKFSCPNGLTKHLLKLLSRYDIASKEWVIRQYDHEVQGGSVLKPLAGLYNDGPSDASVAKPILDSNKGIIISNGINFRYGFIDPYWMAASCIDEALRQIIAVGGSLKEVAILDNFCWGNPDKPDRLGSLVRAAHGCYNTAKAFAVPFISGKDSLNNEYTVKGKSIAIPGTLLISAIGVMEDINKTVSMYAKQPKDLIYIVGDTFDELGGSHYYDLAGFIGNNVPKVNPKKAKLTFAALSKASSSGLIEAMHDCSEGGIGVAAAEMAFAGGLGMELFLAEIPYRETKDEGRRMCNHRNDSLLFSESNSRFIVEVEKKNQKKFENILKGIPFGLAGCISDKKEFNVYGLDGKICLKSRIEQLKEEWQKPLRW